jgi:mannose-6-phosphate isomerase-like protein (cupin superfamily)
VGFTVRNLKEVEDAAPAFGMSPDVEARFARKALESQQVALSYQRLQPNVRMPFGHTHAGQEEIYVVLSGSGRAKLDDDVVELRQWDALRVDPETMRAVEAGADGIEFLAIGGPIGESNDAEMAPGWWADSSSVRVRGERGPAQDATVVDGGEPEGWMRGVPSLLRRRLDLEGRAPGGDALGVDAGD